MFNTDSSRRRISLYRFPDVEQQSRIEHWRALLSGRRVHRRPVSQQSTSLVSLNNEHSKNLFLVQGKSCKAKNELHLVEYNPYFGGIATHQIFSTDLVIERISEDRDASAAVLFSGRDRQKEYFGVARLAVDSIRELTAKEDIHKLSRDAHQNKAAFKPSSLAEFPFRIRE